MAREQKPRIVVFDIGNVLVPRREWERSYLESGVSAQALGAARSKIEEALIRFRLGRLSSRDYFEAVGQLCGCDARIVARGHAAMAGPEHQGVAGLVASLAGRGVRLGLLTNIDPFHWARLLSDESTGPWYQGCRLISALFPRFLLASHHTGMLKPDPAQFRQYERATGHRGASVVFFDDEAGNVATARTLGWDATLVDPGRPVCPQIANELNRRDLTDPARAVVRPSRRAVDPGAGHECVAPKE